MDTGAWGKRLQRNSEFGMYCLISFWDKSSSLSPSPHLFNKDARNVPRYEQGGKKAPIFAILAADWRLTRNKFLSSRKHRRQLREMVITHWR
jgi:hypothetical protein